MSEEGLQDVINAFWRRDLTVNAVLLKEDFDSVSMKPSDVACAQQIANEMVLPLSHVVGIAASRLWRECGEPDAAERKNSAENRIKRFNEDLLSTESARSTPIYIVPAVLEQMKAYCKRIEVDQAALFGLAVREYREFRKKPVNPGPKGRKKS